MSGMMSMMAGNAKTSSGDTNLAYNNASDGYWYRLPFSSITLNLNSAGTITSDGVRATGPTAWYTGSPTGSNFEVRVTWASTNTLGTTTVLVGPSGSESAITLANSSAFYNLGSNILLTAQQLSGSSGDNSFTVVIRQVALPSNSISKTFRLEWAT